MIDIFLDSSADLRLAPPQRQRNRALCREAHESCGARRRRMQLVAFGQQLKSITARARNREKKQACCCSVERFTLSACRRRPCLP